MGHDFRSLLKVDASRWLWLMGVVLLVMIISLQCFPLPYGNVLSSLFSVSNFPTTERTPVSKSYLGFNAKADYSDNGKLDYSQTSENVTSSDNASLSTPLHVVDNDNDNDGDGDGDVDIVEKINDDEDEDEEKSVDQKTQSIENVANTGNASVVQEIEQISLKENTTSLLQAPSPNQTVQTNIGTNFVPSARVVISGIPPLKKDATLVNDESRKVSEKKLPEVLSSAVVPISEMNNMLLQSYVSYKSVRPQWPSTADRELKHAKSMIDNAPIGKKDRALYAPLYRNVSAFKRSYEIMEATLKIYVYKEGNRPILHTPILKGIYASEGWFMKLLKGNKRFSTKNPQKAHLFYLPFSSRMLEETLYVKNSHSHKNLIQYLHNYVDLIAAKHPFWNRTQGADHFLVACHDWAPSETKRYMSNSIRALCNSDLKEGFIFGKDVSLPETFVRMPKNPLRDIGGQTSSKRPILAFFAGNMHGYLRPILLQHWENKDPDMKIYGRMPKSKNNRNYIQYMKSSKYCICAKGYEVNSPRVVEAIFHECVPVIISDNFVPPFFETLNWESFTVFVLERDIPNLKEILLSISNQRYQTMQMRVKRVQQHFLWHDRPVKYDLFHMILHSIWYTRVLQMQSIPQS